VLWFDWCLDIKFAHFETIMSHRDLLQKKIIMWKNYTPYSFSPIFNESACAFVNNCWSWNIYCRNTNTWRRTEFRASMIKYASARRLLELPGSNTFAFILSCRVISGPFHSSPKYIIRVKVQYVFFFFPPEANQSLQKINTSLATVQWYFGLQEHFASNTFLILHNKISKSVSVLQ
jgi:hypothetical protein